jgi:hypothetical protein
VSFVILSFRTDHRIIARDFPAIKRDFERSGLTFLETSIVVASRFGEAGWAGVRFTAVQSLD